MMETKVKTNESRAREYIKMRVPLTGSEVKARPLHYKYSCTELIYLDTYLPPNEILRGVCLRNVGEVLEFMGLGEKGVLEESCFPCKVSLIFFLSLNAHPYFTKIYLHIFP